MDFIDPRAEFRREVGEWLDRELTDELREEFAREITYLRVPMAWSPEVLEFNRRLGAKGWIGLHWPTKYGGRSATSWWWWRNWPAATPRSSAASRCT